MINKVLLREYTAAFGVELTDEMCDRFDRYAQLLVEWNQKMNLTAIVEPDDIVLKHFADSLTALPLLPKREGITLIDVGTGAGFPAVALLIARPDLKVTLLDSLNKRLTFLQEVCRELGLSAQTVHARAEEGGRDSLLREAFDVATARAVAALPVLSEYCLPFVKTGGIFLAMKGPESDAEHAQAERAIRVLGGRVKQVEHRVLPVVPKEGVEQLERRIFVIEKQQKTPNGYPRPTAKIKKGAIG